MISEPAFLTETVGKIVNEVYFVKVVVAVYFIPLPVDGLFGVHAYGAVARVIESVYYRECV